MTAAPTTWRQNPGLAKAGTSEVEIILRAHGWWRPIDWRELWRHRELLGLMVWRDVKVRYKQTVLGAAWAILQPLALMVVISVFIGRFTGMADPVVLYAGLLPWTFFAAAVGGASNSVVNHQHMIQKVYFPRLLIPISAIGAPLLDYLLASTVLFALMAWRGAVFSVSLCWLPVMTVSMVLAALGTGVMLAALCVSYRDFRYVVPFLLQVWFFASGVIVPIESVRWGWLLPVNPMFGLVTAMRAAALDQPIDFAGWAVSTLVAAGCLLVGVLFFQNRERRFADII